MEPLSANGKSRARQLLAVLVSVACLLAVAGCGDTPSDADVESARPALSIPNDPVTPGESSGDDTTGTTGATGDTGGSGTDTGTDTGGTTPDDTGGGDTGGQGDNADNGTNTGGGQQYDQFCQENPGACGD